MRCLLKPELRTSTSGQLLTRIANMVPRFGDASRLIAKTVLAHVISKPVGHSIYIYPIKFF